MKTRRTGSTLLVRIDRGELLAESLTKALIEQNVSCASVSGIGAVEKAELLYYDIHAKTYEQKRVDELCELLSLSGNVSLRDGKPWAHLHAVLGDRRMNAIGGHLKEAVVGVTCEIIVTIMNDPLARSMDEGIGLQTWNL